MRSLALVAALLLATTTHAQPLAIHLGGYSYHIATGHKVNYNDWHQLAAVEYGPYMAGHFKNSYGRDTTITAYRWSKQWGDLRGSIHVGAMHGYRSCYGDEGETARICPVAFPALYWTKYKVQPGVIVFGEAVTATVRVALY